MIIIITGASHVGKTNLAQMLLEKYQYPYLSIDHLKMGLIRSGNTKLTPYDDLKLEDYLWLIVKEIIKTAIENKQNLIVEGCYVPSSWRDGFSDDYLRGIKFIVLAMTKDYIINHFEDLKKYQNVVEKRLYDDLTIEQIIEDNEKVIEKFKDLEDITLIDGNYLDVINKLLK